MVTKIKRQTFSNMNTNIKSLLTVIASKIGALIAAQVCGPTKSSQHPLLAVVTRRIIHMIVGIQGAPGGSNIISYL